ncbi:Excinuclease ABC subunit C [Thauera humireducens]|nr:Excinuclease ABC subunit C [Thauera humireducens]
MSKIQSVGGVYCLFNKANGKRYVGKSKNLRKRLKAHPGPSHSNDMHFLKIFRKFVHVQ